MHRKIAAGVGLIAMLAVPLPADDSGTERSAAGKMAVQSEMERIQGTWIFESMQYNGEDVTAKENLGRWKLIIKGDSIVGDHWPKSKFTLDPDKSPPRLFVVMQIGSIISLRDELYQLDNNTLKICAAGNCKLPLRFSSEGKQTIHTFRRQK